MRMTQFKPNLQYWRFYWPLVITGLSMMLVRQFQNGTLARYPDATREIAIFALASSTFFLFHSMHLFLPQLINVYVRSREAKGVCFRFTVGLGVILSLPVLFFAYSRPGEAGLSAAFHIEGAVLEGVRFYLQMLAPLILINALRHFNTGLLVQARRTGVLTVLNAIYLSTMVAILIVGFCLQWRPAVTVSFAQVLSASVDLVLSTWMRRRVYRLPGRAEHTGLTTGELLSFFWPVALTSTMFALNRPILYSFLSRMPDAEPVIAALRVGFDFTMLFHNPINQFRHLFITFGKDDPGGVRRFMTGIMVIMTLSMVTVAGTPLGTLMFRDLLGVEGSVLQMAIGVIWIQCLIPVVTTVRNYFHGIAMIERKTRKMGAGAVVRNLIVYFGAWACFDLGWLNHLSASALIVLGFAVETATVAFLSTSPETSIRRQAARGGQSPR